VITKYNKPGIGLNRGVKKFLAKVDAIEVIPPDNGVSYLLDTIMHVGEGEVVRISERGRNLAVIMATENLIQMDAIVRAGYRLQPQTIKSFGPKTKLAVIKNTFRQKFVQSYTIKIQKLQHFIERDACKAIGIDAAWVLGKQVELFELCKAKGDNTNAVRLLNDISYHTEVDSRVSNRVVVEHQLDYAALLQEADQRALPAIEVEVEEAQLELVSG